MKIEDMSNVYLRALFYGDSGAGKTHLLGTAMMDDRSSPMLVLNARGQPITFRYLEHMPLVLTVEKMTDFNTVYHWIIQDQPLPRALKDLEFVSDKWYDAVEGLPMPFNAIYKYLSGHSVCRFKTLAIDSITQVQRIANDTIMDYDDTNYSPEKVPDRRGYSEYQKMLDMMMKFADHHFRLPIHVLMTALCRHNEMPTLGITKYYPFLWGQGALEVPSYAELVGRLVNIESITTQQINAMSSKFEPAFKGEQPYNVLYTRGGRDFIAKWQGIVNPPDLVINPTITKLLDAVDAN